MAINKNLDMGLILESFEMYEQGMSMSSCFIWLGISRKTWSMYLMGEYRGECREEHLKKYPNGRVFRYISKNAMRFYTPHH